MIKTQFCSYCINGIPEGCKSCVKGKKLVIFISGICSRNCWYCSLSKKRKSVNKTWVNERECKTLKEMINEAVESNSTGAGITGGDPLLFMPRVLKFASALKKKFGKKFHIHIYLPTKLLTKEKLKKLAKVIDEVRFHPDFLAKRITEEEITQEIEKIKQAKSFWKKDNIGIELPMIPDKKHEILDFILKIKEDIGFVNLNEFELSETNIKSIIKKYKLKQGGYVVSGSKEAGLWVLKNLMKRKARIRAHLCTADTKNKYQYLNRLKLHKILPYGKKTKEGTVTYLTIKGKLKLKNTYYDKKKNRTILSEGVAKKLLGKHKIIRVEEFPTYDNLEVEEEII